MAKKLLLHVCCGPCATHVIDELKKDYDVTLFFYNPNIHPCGEFVKRLGEAQKVASAFGVPLVEGGYDVDSWLRSIAGLEEEPEGGRRCTVCFADRLSETALFAKENGFDYFTTTLTISPHKDSEVINRIGSALAGKHGVCWIHSDFKKKDGFRKSSDMSKKLSLYRQRYCGCFYSVKSVSEKAENPSDSDSKN